MTLTTPTLPTTAATPVTHVELERAWRALQAGVFRRRSDVAPDDVAAHLADDGPLAIGAVFAGPVVVVAGCHGWAGTSTAALLLAEGYARRGVPVRLLDAAAAARSGLAGTAVTEHGLDSSRRWRCGSRGGVAVHRIAGPLAGVVDVPQPPVTAEGTVTVVDAGWPIPDLLAGVSGHWLPSLLQEAPLLLTAQANVPGLRHAEVTLEELATAVSRATPPLVLLRGARRRWRLSATSTCLLDAERDGCVHVLPEQRDLTAEGLTTAPLPRQLHPVGDRLAQILAPASLPTHTTTDTSPGGQRTAGTLRDVINRKDHLS